LNIIDEEKENSACINLSQALSISPLLLLNIYHVVVVTVSVAAAATAVLVIAIPKQLNCCTIFHLGWSIIEFAWGWG